MSSETLTPARACAEQLLGYQSTIMHDLRGELNGLLLTLELVRRQLSSQQELPPSIAESMSDLDLMRGSLTRTLNQLDAVSHARRVIDGRQTPEAVTQNLADLVSDVAHSLAERTRRRHLDLSLPPPSEISVRMDAIVVRLLLHRMLSAAVENCRNTSLRLRIDRDSEEISTAKPAFLICVTVTDGGQLPAECLTNAEQPIKGDVRPSAAQAALALTMTLVKQLGGSITWRAEDDGGSTLRLSLPG